MNKEQAMVLEFHKTFGLTVNEKPTYPNGNDTVLRDNLIYEESIEFSEAKDLKEKLDALADILYVVYGAAVTYGFDLEPAFAEVHRSNMSKLWTYEEVLTVNNNEYDITDLKLEDKKSYIVKRKSDGKVIKSPSYSPANLEQFLK